jgi:hypothetical protein
MRWKEKSFALKNICFTDFTIKSYICSPFKVRVVAQPGSAFAWGARGRWFESSPPDLPAANPIRPG